MTNPLPMIRLDIEGMRHSVVHAFNEHSKEVEEAVSKAVNEAIANFDFAGTVAREARAVIGELVKRAMTDAIQRAFESPEIGTKMASAVESEVWKWANSK